MHSCQQTSAAILILLCLCGCKTNDPGREQDAVPVNNKVNLTKASDYNVQLGMAYLKQGNMSRAKRKLVTALNQTPHSASANGAMAYFFETTGQSKKADEYYRKAMKMAPGQGAELNNYGTFLCRRGYYQQAEQYFKKAISDVNYVNSPAALENAGLCALEAKHLASAKNYFEQALQQDPHRMQSLEQLVVIALKQGDVVSAEEAVNRYARYVDNTKQLSQLKLKLAGYKKHHAIDVAQLRG